MEKHVKVVGWLWIVNGVVSILMFIIGLIIVNTFVPGAQDALLVTIGGFWFFIPGIIASLSGEDITSMFIAVDEKGQPEEQYGLIPMADLVLSFTGLSHPV